MLATEKVARGTLRPENHPQTALIQQALSDINYSAL